MNPQTSPQPPHPIFDLEPSSTLWMTQLVLGAIPLVILLAVLGLWLYKRRQASRRPGSLPDVWEQLEQRVTGLSWHEKAPADYFGTLSAALREGLEKRQGKPFSAWTRREVLRELQERQAFSSDFQANCAEFLEAAEKVQYGGLPVDESTAVAWKERVRNCLRTIREPAS